MQFGIICGLIEDHFPADDHLRSGIICGGQLIEKGTLTDLNQTTDPKRYAHGLLSSHLT